MVWTMVFQVYLTKYLNENGIATYRDAKIRKAYIVSEFMQQVWPHEFEIHYCCSWIYSIARKYGRLKNKGL